MTSVRDQWGLACPNCASDEYLQVQVTVMANLSVEGSDPCSDQVWEDDSFIRCRSCFHTGTVKSFGIEEDAP